MNDMARAEGKAIPSTSEQSSEAKAAQNALLRKLSEQLAFGHPYGSIQAG